MEVSQAFEVPQDQELKILRDLVVLIAYSSGNSAIGFTELELSCTTNGTYVVQDKRTFNHLSSSRVCFMEKYQAFEVSQDQELKILRDLVVSIAYSGGNSAIESTDVQLSCTTNGIYVVQDEGEYNAS